MKQHRLLRRTVAVLAPLVVFATACTSASDADTTRDDDGAVVEEGQVGVFRLREGDCVRLPASLRDADAADTENLEEVEDFEAVPCDEPHDGEVVLVDDEHFADLDEFPGDANMATQANPPCIAALDVYTGTDFESSSFSVLPLVPTSASWDGIDDRGLICVGVTLDDAMTGVIDTTGSFRSAG